MFLLTWHGTIVTKDVTSSDLLSQVTFWPGTGLRSLLSTSIDDLLAICIDEGGERVPINEARKRGLKEAAVSTNSTFVETPVLSKRPDAFRCCIAMKGYFLAAEPSVPSLYFNRSAAYTWEEFMLLSHADLIFLKNVIYNIWYRGDENPIGRHVISILPGFIVSVDGIHIAIEDILCANQLNRDQVEENRCPLDLTSMVCPMPNGEHRQFLKFDISFADRPLDLALQREIAGSRGRKPREITLLRASESSDSLTKRAITNFHLGNFVKALELLDQEEEENGQNDDLVFYRRRIIERLSRPTASVSLGIMWRARPKWEQDWLETLLPKGSDIDCNIPIADLSNRNIIVIDTRITSEKVDFYREAFDVACNIFLVHLSDEYLTDDHRVYRWCKSVYRNYYSPILAEEDTISFFALGYKSGFSSRLSQTPVLQRPNRWSFAGDGRKTTRIEMLKAMRNVAGGCEHLTSGFDAADALDVHRYCDLMTQSVFIPCPMGGANLDSFRIYEALEAGCIPIVEKRPGFDYFQEMYGNYPFLAIDYWSEAPGLVSDLLADNAKVISVAENCASWWRAYKHNLKRSIKERFAIPE